MKPMSLCYTGLVSKGTRPRRPTRFGEQQRKAPWPALVTFTAPHAPRRRPKGDDRLLARDPAAPSLSAAGYNRPDPAMQEALYDTPMSRDCAGLDMGEDSVPDETTLLRVRPLLDECDLAQRRRDVLTAVLTERGLMLRQGMAVDARWIAAPRSTRNEKGKRVHLTKHGNPRRMGMKARLGVDANWGLVPTGVGPAADVHDVTQAHALLHRQGRDVFADAGDQGAGKREETQDLQVYGQVAMGAGKRRALDEDCPVGAVSERLKAHIRAKVGHPFQLIQQPSGDVKVKHCGLAKNVASLRALFALANLWLECKRLLLVRALRSMRPHTDEFPLAGQYHPQHRLRKTTKSPGGPSYTLGSYRGGVKQSSNHHAGLMYHAE